jgi:hypothetical protein
MLNHRKAYQGRVSMASIRTGINDAYLTNEDI